MIIKVANLIADFLAQKGIDTVFSVTGGGAMHLNDAFGHHDRLKIVYNHHEQACAIGAEGFARTAGKPAAVCVTSGPGGTNAITGVMGAWVDSIPMFVLSGQVKFATTTASVPNLVLRQLGDQEFNIIDSIRCMTKYSLMIKDESEILYHLEKAWYTMLEGRQGPVWLDVPLNIQGAQVDTNQLKHFEETELCPPPYDEMDQTEIDALKFAVLASKSPVIFAGTAIRNCCYTDRLIQFAERLNIPIVTAWNAHDTVSENHRLYCGRPGTVGTRSGNFVVQNSDMLIVIGCQLNIRQISYNWENFAPNAKIYLIDIDANEIKKPTIKVHKAYRMDLRYFIDSCLSDKDFYSNNHSKWLWWCKEVNQRYTKNKIVNRKGVVNPYEFMDRLSDVLQEGETVICSNGSACVITFQALRLKERQRLFTNSGCASMGYGLPASIGGAIAKQNARVICIEGDGSLQMNIQELATAHYYTPNLKIIVLNNNGYHSIRQTQSNLFKEHALCGINAESGVWMPKLEKIAAAYELTYFRIDDIDNFSTVREFLNQSVASVLEVIVDENQNFEPKLSSKVLPNGKIVSPPIQDMYPFLDRSEYEQIKYEE